MKPTFGQLLKRERVSRRLSQLALAEEVGLSQKHVSFLETGRSNPQRRTILRLTSGIGSSRAVTDQLLEVAGYTPLREPSLDGEEVIVLREAARRILEKQSPYPAVLVTQAQDVVEMNSGLDRLIRIAGRGRDLWEDTCRSGRKNLLRLALSKQGLFPLMAEPDLLVPAYFARVRREALGDDTALDLVNEAASWPHISSILDNASDVPDRAITTESYRLGETTLSLICMVASLGVPRSAEAESLRIELFHPADKETEVFFEAFSY